MLPYVSIVWAKSRSGQVAGWVGVGVAREVGRWVIY